MCRSVDHCADVYVVAMNYMDSSPSAGELKIGAVIDVIATAVLPANGVVRVKFSQSGGLIGWCSMTTAVGDTLLEPLDSDPPEMPASTPSNKKLRSSTGTVVTVSGANNDAVREHGHTSNSSGRSHEKAGRTESTSAVRVRSARPVKSVAELQRITPFPTEDFLAALAAAEGTSGQTNADSKTTNEKRNQTLSARRSVNHADELRTLMMKRLERVFAKCVLPDGSPDGHIASDSPVDTERAAMAVSLAACMSPEQIAQMIENTERSHLHAATVKAKREERRQRRHSMDGAIKVQ